MHRKNLLTQVLVANLLLIVAAVVVTGVAGNPNFDVSGRPGLVLILALAVALTIVVNVIMLQRRFRPLERLGDPMEGADPPPPRAKPPAPTGGPRGPPGGGRVERALPRGRGGPEGG